MGEAEHWICPYCNHDVVLQDSDRQYHGIELKLKREPAEGHKSVVCYYRICPNPSCKRYSFAVALFDLEWLGGKWMRTNQISTWNLVPPSRARAFPDYIPKSILDDYNEACLIVDLSPKASATLSRRCLQGIIRDFWGVKPSRLVDEIELIRDKTDSDTWEAIDSVRRVGNIGAHMEKDINLIVDVEPNEAALLINLIEILLKDWYVAREERKTRLALIKSVAESKDDARKKTESEE